MLVDGNHRLAMKAGNDFAYRFDPSPNVNPKAMAEKRILVIHAPGSASVGGAASHNTSAGQSRHLILGRDGRTLWQTLPFNKGAKHLFFAGASKYDDRTIAIELEYPGELIQGAPAFNRAKKLDADQYLRASPLNNSRYGDWPLYPREQLDALAKIAGALANRYEIEDIVGYEEIADHRKDPGPAFPIIQFRERILGVNKRSFALQEMKQAAQLRGQPPVPGQNGSVSSLLPQAEVPAGAQVAVVNEMYDWYLIAVVGEAGGNQWLLGWVEKSKVRVKTNSGFRVTDDHLLVTGEGRRVQMIEPHRNGYTIRKAGDDPEINTRYIVMHFTTGLKMESTISHFKDSNSRVSTHLLIGRDGRVIQFLPFDRIAHHCGFSWWEGESNLNNYSIGIELDNAGLLSRAGENRWTSRKIEVPAGLVERKWYWKLNTPDPANFKGWEKFTDVQLEVARKIVKALKERYLRIGEILGHDEVNISNRYDPGPLFPMKDFRMELFGREHPDYKVYRIKEAADLYYNFFGNVPHVERNREEQRLPANAAVKVIRQDEHMALVTVVKAKGSDLAGSRGWVLKKYLSTPEAKDRRRNFKKRGEETEKAVERRTTTRPQVFLFGKGGRTPTPKLEERSPEGRLARLQKREGDWALVVVLPDEENRKHGFEGWIRFDALEAVADS